MTNKTKDSDETTCGTCGALMNVEANMCPKCGERGNLPSNIGGLMARYLAVRRFGRDRTLQMLSGWGLFLAGLTIGAFFVFVFLASLSETTVPFLGRVFFVLVGAGCFYLARIGYNNKQRANATRRYIDIIVNQKQSSVDNIASIVNKTDVEQVMRELQDQINAGFLNGYAIDRSTREIKKRMLAVTNLTPSGPPVVFNCKACGAQNEVSNTNGSLKCGYCESPYIA